MSLTVEKCIEGWTNSLSQLKVKADIVFYGDSLTYHGDFTSVFPDKVICNLGLRGDTLQGMITRVEQIRLLNPETVYLMAGINNVTNDTIDEFRYHYESLICSVLHCLHDGKIIIQSLLPVNDADFPISCNNRQVVECNNQLVELASKYELKYIDLYSAYEKEGKLPKECTVDGIHLKQNDYLKWYELLTL